MVSSLARSKVLAIFLAFIVISSSLPVAPTWMQNSRRVTFSGEGESHPGSPVPQSGDAAAGSGASTSSTHQVFLPFVRTDNTRVPSAPHALDIQTNAQQALACALYPMALYAATLAAVQPGQDLRDLLNGTQPGSFGWLSWDGNNSVPSLVASLTPPGNSSGYINPADATDHTLSNGDWVRGRAGVANASEVRTALDALKQIDITVPVWDRVEGLGNNARYHIVQFANVRLLDYRLAGQTRISARFLGYNTGCGDVHPPVATDDTYATDEDTVLTVNAPGVLANDLDLDSDPLSAILVDQPVHGTLTLNADGAFSYTPSPNYFGSDTFTYRSQAQGQTSNSAKVTLNVTPVNDAPIAVNDNVNVNEDNAIEIPVLSNDSDVDGPPLTVAAITVPQHGTATQNPVGSVTYTPATDFCGVDGFTYTVSDGNGGEAVGDVTVTITCSNDTPIAHDDTAVTEEDSPVTILVLENDYDADADSLTVQDITPPAHGTITRQSDQSVIYTPAVDFNGTDSFTYKVCDPSAACVVATTTVVVGGLNDMPQPVDDEAQIAEDTPITFSVTANDRDVDGNLAPTTTIVLVEPAQGILINHRDGTFTYQPAPNFHGADSFAYEICDTEHLCASAKVTLTVTSINDAPVAEDDTYTTAEDTLLTLALPGILANDTDVDGDLLSLVAGQPSHGTLAQHADGAFTYTPAADFCGTDTYPYTISDGNGGADEAIVTITLDCRNDAPVAKDDELAAVEDTPLTLNAPGVLGNDHDADGDALSLANVTDPQQGLLVQNRDGSLTYTPFANVCGTDSYTYSVADGQGGYAQAVVTIQIACINDPPVANNDIYTVDAGHPLSQPPPGILDNDTDVDSTGLSALLVTNATHGVVSLAADGGITYTPNAGYHGVDSFTYKANDGQLASNTATVTITVNDQPDLPPDPATVAPALDSTVATNLVDATAFLYTGTDPIQTGVAPDTIKAQRVAVLRGKVLQRDGQPLLGVTISILNHPEFGQTLSRADGMFDLAVNGGGPLTVLYTKAGYLPAQRPITPPWQDYTWLEEVALIQPDPQVTTIDLNASVPMQVARGSVISDTDGVRQATLLFPQGVAATMVFTNGITQPLSLLHVRATEYTVGPNGPASMPARLPPATAYTYATEFNADEAVAAGAPHVQFSQPLFLYLENFLHFAVGSPVPVGSFDRNQDQWAASQDGRVIKLLSITSGMADLDIDGSGQPASATLLAALGITPAERQTLATLYQPNTSLWRVPISHFTSPWDFNWPYGPPAGASGPNQSAPEGDNPLDNPTCHTGSIIECQNQILGEAIGIVGTPFALHYQSERVTGRTAAYTLKIPLSGASVPASLKRIDLEIDIAGQRIRQSFPPGPNQQTVFTWNGKDAYGRAVQGRQAINVRIGYVYGGVYLRPSTRPGSIVVYDALFGHFSYFGTPATGDPTRREVTLWQFWQGEIGAWNALALGLGGWSLSVHHAYDPVSRILYYGDGQRRQAQNVNRVITTVAGNGITGYSGDGLAAVAAALNRPYGNNLAVGPDGTLYIPDRNNHRIRRVSPDGIITTVAGKGTPGFSGDGGLAINAQLNFPESIALAPDGSLYIADVFNHRVRRVAPNGIITTVAGTGTAGFSGDGGLATKAQLNVPDSVVLAPEGSLYISDNNNHRIRRVDPNGIISTVVGSGALSGGIGDGGPAAQARLNLQWGMTIGPDGSLYIADTSNHRVRRVGSDGLITTVAGTGTAGFSGDGGLATQSRLNFPSAVAWGSDGLYIVDLGNNRIRLVGPDGLISTVAGSGATTGDLGDHGAASAARLNAPRGLTIGPDGSLYIADTDNNRIRRVTSPLPGLTPTDILIPDETGREVYVFNSRGRHLRTLHALTNAVLYQFGYDAAGHLTLITDGDGNVTHITRAANDQPTAVVAPFGQVTALKLDANGYLAQITDPLGTPTALAYTNNGLLTTLTDPRGGTAHFNYDTLGRLTQDTDKAGSALNLARVAVGANYSVTLTTALNRQTIYNIYNRADGGQRQLNIFPDSVQSQQQINADGSRTVIQSTGLVATLVTNPDSRWGMQVPLVKSASVKTPGQLTANYATVRTVNLADPANPLSLTSQTDQLTINGKTYTSIYNAATRTYMISTPQGRQVTLTVDTQGRIVQGQIAGLPASTYTYDSHGRLSMMRLGTGADVRSANFVYNSQGYLESMTDSLGHTTRYAYDAAGHVISQTLPGGRTVLLTYDGNDNVTSITPPRGVAHRFTYTPLDLMASYLPPSVGTGNSQVAYLYNVDRQLTQITRPDGQVINAGYDSSGRLSTLTTPRGTLNYSYQPIAGQLGSIVAPGGVNLAYSYDGQLLTSATWRGPISGTVGYRYDNDFHLTALQVNGGTPIAFQYDNDSLLTHAGDLSLSRNAQNGLLTSTTVGNVADAITYDGFGEPATYRATYLGADIFKMNYSYDQVGRIITKTETISGTPVIYGYTYDSAGRLSEVKQNGIVIATYAYDTNGNRVSYISPAGTLNGIYDDQDRLLQYGANAYTYTANGELLSKTTAGQTTTYNYDALNNLITVTQPDSTSIEYLVDGRNRRIGKKVNGVLMQGFLYKDLLEPVAELDSNGRVVSQFVYASRAHVPDYLIKGGIAYRIVTDNLGSVRLVVHTQTGAIVQRIDYDTFGRVTRDTNPHFQPFGFAGGLYDPDTGLVRFGVRDYDAEVGRWTAKDPSGFNGSGTNFYAYVANDPVNLLDTNGRFLSLAGAFVGAGVGALSGILGTVAGELINSADGRPMDWSGLLRNAAIGAAGGFAVGAFGSVALSGDPTAAIIASWVAKNVALPAGVGFLQAFAQSGGNTPPECQYWNGKSKSSPIPLDGGVGDADPVGQEYPEDSSIGDTSLGE